MDRFFVALFMLVIFSRIYAQDFFNTENAWFTPDIEINKDEELCSLFLEEVTGFHLSISDEHFIQHPYEGPNYKGTIGEAIPNEKEFKLNEKDHGEWGVFFTFKDKEYFLINDFYHDGPFLGQNSFLITPPEYESIKEKYDTIREMLRDPLFRKVPVHNAFDFRKYKNNFYTFSEYRGLYSIHKLKDSSDWEQTCSVRYIPKSTRSVNAELKHFGRVIQNIANIRGESSYCWGEEPSSICFHRMMLDELVYRPWRFSADDRSDSHRSITERNERLFASWGYSGLWSYKIYRELKSNLPLAKKELEQFYMKHFAMMPEKAWHLASKGLDYAIGGGFSGQYYNPRIKLHRALLEGYPISEVKVLMDEEAVSNYGYLLSYSIEHPFLLKFLLENGASPNTSNFFGKTPLMYAAQFNQLESAKLLLEFGANPNATTAIERSYISLEITNVTPLHYAVRYASKELIEYLLDHGAVTFIKTKPNYSRRKSEYPSDWLVTYTDRTNQEWNPNIREGDIEYLKQRLQVPSVDELEELSASLILKGEALYQAGDVEQAYRALSKALNLTPHNEKALSSMSLVALRNKALWESLSASLTLLRISKNENLIANAWFNVGLACEQLIETGGNKHHFFVEGKTPCGETLLKPFLSAYVAKPTSLRQEKVQSLFEDGEIPTCRLYSKNNEAYDLHFTSVALKKLVYVYHPNSVDIVPSDYSWKIRPWYGYTKDSPEYLQPELLRTHQLDDSSITILSIKYGVDTRSIGCETKASTEIIRHR